MFAHAVTRPGIVPPRRVDPSGQAGPTPGQARGPHWRRVAPGWYVPSGVPVDALCQRIVDALAGLPPDAVVTGWAALAWRGSRWFRGVAPDGRRPLRVPVTLRTRGARPRSGVEITEDFLAAGDVVVVDGLPVVSVERAVAFEACRARSVTAAVRVVDMACADDLTDVASCSACADQLISRPGVRRFREALTLADENVWSPAEVAMRLTWVRHRPRADLRTNCPLFDEQGRHLVTPDLIDLRHAVVGEYDGPTHLREPGFRRDLDREALYRDLGLELVTMMSADGHDVTSFLARLDGAYARAGHVADQPRRWTHVQPTWWVDTSTVARRRALDDRERSIWLRRLAG